MAEMDLYNAQFMDHVQNPDYRYEMDDPTHTHEGVNPTCGDELVFSVRLGDDGVIEEAAFTGHGCAISQASADIMSDLVTGRSAEEARELCDIFKRMIRGEAAKDEIEQLDEAAILRDISHMPARVKCAELAWRTLDEMLSGDGAGACGADSPNTSSAAQRGLSEQAGNRPASTDEEV